ncbi:alanine racemase [Psittacicella hinzii]|nr:alanine racemase [Psittacicella hinzii]
MINNTLFQQIAKNLTQIKNLIVQIQSKFHKTEQAELIAVTKYATTMQLFALVLNGQLKFGENYLQEAVRKDKSLKFIQYLLTNNLVAVYCDFIAQIGEKLPLTSANNLDTYLSVLFSDKTNTTDYPQLLTLIEQLSKDYLDLSNFSAEILLDCTFIYCLRDWLHIKENHDYLLDALNNLEIHIIGNLQSKKIKDAVAISSAIATVDSVKTLEKIAEQATKQQIASVNILLQLRSPNVTGDNRHGCEPKLIFELISLAKKLPNINIQGIMFIASTQNLPQEYEYAQQVFNNIKAKLGSNCKILSMGMSDSLEVALKYGSTQVRIGSALFQTNTAGA